MPDYVDYYKVVEVLAKRIASVQASDDEKLRMINSFVDALRLIYEVDLLKVISDLAKECQP
jgi:hypothetical protein